MILFTGPDPDPDAAYSAWESLGGPPQSARTCRPFRPIHRRLPDRANISQAHNSMHASQGFLEGDAFHFTLLDLFDKLIDSLPRRRRYYF